MRIRLICLILLALNASSCSKIFRKKSAKLSVEITRPSTPLVLASPANPTGFDCVMVNVIAADLPSQSPDRFPLVVLDRDSCGYPGALSPAVGVPAAGGTAEIELDVPIGPARTVQVLGISLGLSGLQCSDIDSSNLYPEPGQALQVEAYELGRHTADIFDDTTLDIANTYLPSKRANCESASGVLPDGTYTTACLTNSYQAGAVPFDTGSYRTVIINGNSMTINNVVTDNLACGGVTVTTLSQTATYVLGNAYTDTPNSVSGNEITLTFSGTSVNTLVAGTFNGSCGLSISNSTWEDLSGTCSTSAITNNSPYPGAGTVRHDIVSIVGGNLFFGKFLGSDDGADPGAPLLKHTPGSADSAADRATEFLMAVPYVK